MADQNPTCRESDDSFSSADKEVEAAVLSFVLDEHPDHLTTRELILAMNRDEDDFSAVDAIERAVRELIGAGLLYLGGGLVLPTRSALYFTRLPML
jgi:hypothetical protein